MPSSLKIILISLVCFLISNNLKSQNFTIQAWVPFNQQFYSFQDIVSPLCYNNPPFDTTYKVVCGVDYAAIPGIPGFNWYLMISPDSYTEQKQIKL